MFKYIKMFECNKWLDTFKYKMVIVLGVFSLFFNLVSCGVSESVKAKTDDLPVVEGEVGLKNLTLEEVKADSVTISWDAIILNGSPGASSYEVTALTNGVEAYKDMQAPVDVATMNILTLRHKVTSLKEGVLTKINIKPMKLDGTAGVTSIIEVIPGEKVSSESLASFETTASSSSKDITVSWAGLDGAYGYLIRVRESESRLQSQSFGPTTAMDIVEVVCSSKQGLSLSCPAYSMDGGKIKYMISDLSSGFYKVGVTPFSFGDLKGLKLTGEDGKKVDFVEEVKGIISSSITATATENTVSLEPEEAGAPVNLNLMTSESEVSASWEHGEGADAYEVVLKDKSDETQAPVTNTISLYDENNKRDPKYKGAGFTIFSEDVKADTAYMVTVTSMFGDKKGGSVSGEATTKSAGSGVFKALNKVIPTVSQETGQPGKLKVVWDTEEVDGLVGYNVYYYNTSDSMPSIPQYVAEKGKTNLMFEVSPGSYKVKVDALGGSDGVVAGDESSAVQIYGLPMKVSGLLVWYKRMTVANVGNKLYPLSYPISFKTLMTEQEAGGPLSGVTYTVRQRKSGGEWKVTGENLSFDEGQNMGMGTSFITNLADDQEDAEKLKAEYGLTYEVEIIASNGGKLSSRFSEKVKFVSFPDPVPVSAMTVSSNDKRLDISWEAAGDKYSDGGSTVAIYLVGLVVSRDGSLPSPLATPAESAFVRDRSVSFTNLNNNLSYYLTIMPVSSLQLTLVDGMQAKYGSFSSISEKPPEEMERIKGSLNMIFGTYFGGVPGPYIPFKQGDKSFPPEAPTAVILDKDADNPDTAITVSWTAPTDAGKDSEGNDADSITKYIVQWGTDSSFPAGENTKSKDFTETSVTIDGLTSETKYFVRVSAVNSAGVTGEFSSSKSHTVGTANTGQSAAPGVPTSVTLTKDTDNPSTAISVSWTAPTETGKNSDGTPASISKYTVEWSTVAGFSDDITSESTVQTTMAIIGLKPETKYYVRVKAVNSAGLEGSLSAPESYTTDADQSAAPGVPTSVILAEDADNPTTAISVSWTAPTETGKNSDGTPATITGYKVEYSTATDFSDSSTSSRSTESTSITITGLTPGIQYYVRVRAYLYRVGYVNLTGGFSEAQSAYTLSAPGVSTGVILAEDADNPTTAISVSWTAPTDPGKKSDGTPATITKYIVEWSTDSDFPMGENTKNEESTTASYTITGLTAGTQYFVRVLAINSVGLTGGFSEAQSAYTLSAPGVSTGVILAEDADNPTTAISVSWTAPTDPGKKSDGTPATITRYLVEWSTDSDFPMGENTKNEESTTTSYTITGLTAGTQYFVRVLAISSLELIGGVSATASATTTQ